MDGNRIAAYRHRPADQADDEVAEVILIVGRWQAWHSDVDVLRLGDRLIVKVESRVRACQLAMSRYSADWVILGDDLDDARRDALASAVRLISDQVLLAVLGPEGDLTVSERWLRRGCAAYLEAGNPVGRVLEVLRFARETGVLVVDKCFQVASRPGQMAPVSELTRREREVLYWLRQGRRNHEIADTLTVSESTVGFHVRNVLEKLGARNRLEAVKRADTLGL